MFAKENRALVAGLVAGVILVAVISSLLILRGRTSPASRTGEDKGGGTEREVKRTSEKARDLPETEKEQRENRLNEIKQLEQKPVQETQPGKVVVAWQPSHQNDTGTNWHEYEICGDIVDKTIAFATGVQNAKCWDLSHGLTGSNNYNPSPTNTVAFDNEVEQANQAGALYFVAIHNDGGAPSGVLGEYLPGDAESQKLADQFVKAVCAKTGLPNRGLRPVRLYSLEADRNHAKYKCLLEIGDNAKDRVFLENPANRELIARALADAANGFTQ